jgi:HAD superfamily hydrolase (TIGR01490 family)
VTSSASAPPPKKLAAFFDVDNTIIRGASAFHIARGLHRRGYLRNTTILRYGWQSLKYVLFGERATPIGELGNDALSIIRGWSVAEMTSIGEEVYDEVISLRIFPGTKGLLDAHIARGHEVWLITTSPIEVGRVIAKRLGATGALGTVAEHEHGYYTGSLVGELLHGPAKARAALQLAEERGLDLDNSFAYGDSFNDTYILSTVGFPCAINPERRLRRYAKRHGWPIRDFRGKRSDGRRSLMATTGAGTLWAVLVVVKGVTAPLRAALRSIFRPRKRRRARAS